MNITGCSLSELVDDPLISLVMKSDGVDRCDLERLLERVGRERLRALRPADPCESRLPATATETEPCSHC